MTKDDVRYWVGVASAEHVARGVAGGFCQLNHGKAGPVARMRPGDGLVYYAPRERMGEGEPVQAFVAIGTVAEGEPYQGVMGDFLAMRRDVRWWPVERRAPIRPMLDALSFTRGQPNWGMVLRRGSFGIAAEDFGLIVEAMGATGP
jgi:hypothetical protein